MKKFDLEDRLINFSVSIIKLSEQIQSSKAGNHLASQIVRSGTSASLNYGEAQSAESQKDFIHKCKIILKELRETYVCLKLLIKAELVTSENINSIITENNELIAIFVKSIQTAQKRIST